MMLFFVLFHFGFVLDVSCWMSPDSEVIWIFVAFLVMIEVVSDTNAEYIYIHPVL